MDSIFEEEKNYLNLVNNSLKNELEQLKESLDEIAKRKISFNDAKRGEQFVKADLMRNYIERINRLSSVASSPYFGRMDFKEDGEDETKSIYIGRTSLSKGNDTLVVDWRSPISSMYYNCSNGKASYEAPIGLIEGNIELKRQIIIENYTLKNILDTDIVTNDEILQEYLNVHADERMKNIIASIQEEQNYIIRQPINKNIIVQGVAGSGKTSVALHRIAYLLYNAKDGMGSDKFLLLGPNNYFLDYISSVLPELETDPIKQGRYLDFTNDYINEQLKIVDDNYKPTKEEINNYENVKRYKNSLNYKDSIEKFMKQYLLGNFVEEGIIIDGVEIFDKSFVVDALLSTTASRLNFERAKIITLSKYSYEKDKVYSVLRKRYQDIYNNPNASTEDKKSAKDKSSQLYDTVYRKGEQIIKNYYKKIDYKISDIYVRFISECEKYIKDLDIEKVDLLKKISLGQSGKKKITSDDLPALNYIQYLLTGKTIDYKQIAIDEAQDYGLFHYYALIKACPKANFSIYGDLAQAIYPYTNISDWNCVVNEIFDGNCELDYLNKSYRTTREITDNANLVLDAISLCNADSVDRHGEDVQYIQTNRPEVELSNIILSWIQNGYQSVGIICKTEKEALKLYKNLVLNEIPVSYLDDNTTKYEGGVYITTSIASKGLEFDAVVINNASNEIYDSDNSIDMHLLYVALTRALHELKIMYDKDITSALSSKVQTKTKIKNR